MKIQDTIEYMWEIKWFPTSCIVLYVCTGRIKMYVRCAVSVRLSSDVGYFPSTTQFCGNSEIWPCLVE